MMNFLKNVSFSIALFLIGAIFITLGLSSSGFNAGTYALKLDEIWARIISLVIGLTLVTFAIYIEIRSKSATNKEESETKANKSSFLTTGKFIKIDERDFLKEIDISNVNRLFVLGHTGRKVYEVVHERLENIIAQNGANFPEEIRILIRAPIVEGVYRNNYIQNTITKVKTLRDKKKNIDVRFYESIPAVRGIICEYRAKGKDKTRDSYITSYYWPQYNTSKSFDFAYIAKDTIDSPKPETNILESWIEQYWGKDEIHTVVFDFDDTLGKTRGIQVKAWEQVIDEYLKRGIIKVENLSSKLQKVVNLGTAKSSTNPTLLKTIENIFIDKQLAEAIAQDIFIDVKDEALKQINKRRFEIRESMMEKVELFEGVEKMLDRLHSHFNLAIISSTDELLISEFLKKKDLLKYFPIILGKRDPSLRYERENIYHKTSLLIKLSEIIGMPLSRLVYIGDNNSDYLATRQLGIAFIEARQAAKLAGKESIITDIDSSKPPLGYFESFENDQLPDLLGNHSENLTRSKYQIQI